jgi:hypothetical protein
VLSNSRLRGLWFRCVLTYLLVIFPFEGGPNCRYWAGMFILIKEGTRESIVLQWIAAAAAAAALFPFRLLRRNIEGGYSFGNCEGAQDRPELFRNRALRTMHFSVLGSFGAWYVLASSVSLPDDWRYWYLTSPTGATGAAALTRRKRLWNMCLSGLGSFWLLLCPCLVSLPDGRRYWYLASPRGAAAASALT